MSDPGLLLRGEFVEEGVNLGEGALHDREVFRRTDLAEDPLCSSLDLEGFRQRLRTTESEVILATAERDAQKLRGEGDAKATETYANAYGKNPEFYAFYRSIDAYKNSIGKQGDGYSSSPM